MRACVPVLAALLISFPQPVRADPDPPGIDEHAARGVDWILRRMSQVGWEQGFAKGRTSAGLSVVALTFLSRGHTHRFGTHKRQVNRLLRALRRRVGPDGKLVDGERFENQALATIALGQAHFITRDPFIKRDFVRALSGVRSFQLSSGGFPSKAGGLPDTLSTVLGIHALKTGQLAKVPLMLEPLTNACDFLRAQIKGKRFNAGPTPDAGAARAALGVALNMSGRPRAESKRALALAPAPKTLSPLACWYYSHSAFVVGGDAWKKARAAVTRRVFQLSHHDRGPKGGVAKGKQPLLDTCYLLLAREVQARYARISDGGGADRSAIPLKAFPTLKAYRALPSGLKDRLMLAIVDANRPAFDRRYRPAMALLEQHRAQTFTVLGEMLETTRGLAARYDIKSVVLDLMRQLRVKGGPGATYPKDALPYMVRLLQTNPPYPLARRLTSGVCTWLGAHGLVNAATPHAERKKIYAAYLAAARKSGIVR